MKLNNLLLNPLVFVSPALLFDGQLIMYYVHKKDIDSIARKGDFKHLTLTFECKG